jgi:hypothetical protein
MQAEEIQSYLEHGAPLIQKLAQEVLRLRSAIEKHASARGNELCWLNDIELWKTIDENIKYPHETLPRREEFLKNCAKYHESRVKGTRYVEPPTENAVTGQG